MATNTASSLEPRKRRRRKDENNSGSAQKKRGTVAAVSPEEVDFQDQALQLEEKILESRTNYNSIQTLLEHFQHNDVAEKQKIIAAVALCRVFCRLMAGGSLSKLREGHGNEVTITQWLRQRLQNYEQGLLRMLRTENIGTQSIALNILMRLVKEKASHLNQSKDDVWLNGLFGQLVQTLVEEEITQETRSEFVEKYVKEYEDVRFYTFACLAYVLKLPRANIC